VWVVNGFFVFMPSLNVDQTNNVVGGWTAFVGGSIFEVGSYLMILEALNRKHEVPRPPIDYGWWKVCFGDAIRGVFGCTHHFHNRNKPVATEAGKVPEDKTEQQWIWFGTRWHELGFVACAIQLFGATVFWISTVTGIPGVIDMDNVALVDGIFWVPQVIGGWGFIISRSFPTHNLCNWELMTVWCLCLKFNRIGIIFVRLIHLVGMWGSGTLSVPWDLRCVVRLGLRRRSHGPFFRADVRHFGVDGLSWLAVFVNGLNVWIDDDGELLGGGFEMKHGKAFGGFIYTIIKSFLG
jgi:hypothetical protein